MHRPPQAMFEPERLRKLGLDVDERQDATSGRQYFIFHGQRFIDGFLSRTFPIKFLIRKDVNPKLNDVLAGELRYLATSVMLIVVFVASSR